MRFLAYESSCGIDNIDVSRETTQGTSMFLWHQYHPIELKSAYFHVILVLFIIASAIDHGYKLALEKGSENKV